jgi:hypothetical protein
MADSTTTRGHIITPEVARILEEELTRAGHGSIATTSWEIQFGGRKIYFRLMLDSVPTDNQITSMKAEISRIMGQRLPPQIDDIEVWMVALIYRDETIDTVDSIDFRYRQNTCS